MLENILKSAYIKRSNNSYADLIPVEFFTDTRHSRYGQQGMEKGEKCLRTSPVSLLGPACREGGRGRRVTRSDLGECGREETEVNTAGE